MGASAILEESLDDCLMQGGASDNEGTHSKKLAEAPDQGYMSDDVSCRASV